MDWRWCRRALELGCLFSIDPDAHSTEEIDNIQRGVLMARKGGVPKERVLNALDLQQFGAHLEARKERRRALDKRRSDPSRNKRHAMHSGRRREAHARPTQELQELWAKVAFETLSRTGDEGRAIREANAVVARQDDE